MRKITFQLFLIALLGIQFLNAQTTFVPYYQTLVNQCSQANVTQDLTDFESLGLKRRGTTSLENTFQWLKSKYDAYGYAANQMQEFSYKYNGSTASCKNLVVNKTGTLYPDTYVIVCGHYDSIGGTGTNDNGSGVAVILEMARILQSIPSEYSIKFINFSGEEDGLKGSQNFVNTVVNSTTPKMNIRLVFNIDEVGGIAGVANNTITCEKDISTPTTNNEASVAFTNQMVDCVKLYSNLYTTISNCYASDYMSFQSNNDVITGMFETNETPVKHTANDFLSNMDPVYNYNVARAAIGFLLHATNTTTVLSTNDYNENFHVSFYPNPTKDILNISSGTINDADFSFKMIDINGRNVYHNNFENNSLEKSIDIKNISKGIYLGVLEAGDKRITKKIVVE